MKKVFVSSSWINRHAVELLCDILDPEKFDVGSFVADNDHEYSAIGQNRDVWSQSIDYGEWVNSDEGKTVFDRDISAIREADVVILIEPAGRDSWAHVGLAYALGKPIYGLNSRGRKVGLMRRMVIWSKTYHEMILLLNKTK